jgi:hypothetical protein
MGPKKVTAVLLVLILIISACGAILPISSSVKADDPKTLSQISSRSTFLAAYMGTTPTVDGVNATGDHWGNAQSDDVVYEGGTLHIAVKHDSTNLFILLECISTSGFCPADLFFEDDGVSHDHSLDSINEDAKYVGAGGFPDGFCDAHWDSGWSVGGEYGTHMNGGAEATTAGNTITEEWWLPLNSGDVEDISVTGQETLGFGVGWNGGWPDSSVGPYSPSSWGDLQIMSNGINSQPVVTITSPTEGSNVAANFTVKATAYDPDLDTLAFVDISINHGPWHHASLSGSTWNYQVDTSSNSSGDKFNLRAVTNDGTDDSEIDEVNVTMITNHPPTSNGPLPDQTFDEDAQIVDALDLDNYFHDTDMGQVLAYSVAGIKHISIVIGPDGTIDLSAEKDWSGTETATVRASDGMAFVESKLKVVVIPVDDPPVVQTLGSIQVEEDTSYTMDLTTYISDIDSAPYVLHMTTDSKYATVAGLMITFMYPNGVLQEQVNVTVMDATSKVTVPLYVMVIAINDAPVIQSPILVSAIEDTALVLDLWDYTSDVDNPQSDLRFSFNQTRYFKKDPNGHTLVFLYPNGISSENIEVRAFDGLLWSMGVIKVEVTPVNDPPTLEIDNVTVTETETVNLIPTINDIDNFVAELKVTYSGDMKTHKWVTGYDDAGNYTVDVTVFDGEFSVKKTITVTVLNKNRAPIVALDHDTIKTYTAKKNHTFQALTLSDPDNDPLVVSWDFGDGKTATGVSPHHVYRKGGTYTIKVTVKDTFGASASDSIDVKVKEQKSVLPGFEGLVLVMVLAVLAVVVRHRRR